MIASPAYCASPVGKPRKRARNEVTNIIGKHQTSGTHALVILCFSLLSVLAQKIEVTNFKDFYELTPERASNGAPVRINGVVLCYDFGWNQLYLFDGKESAWLSPQA